MINMRYCKPSEEDAWNATCPRLCSSIQLGQAPMGRFCMLTLPPWTRLRHGFVRCATPSTVAIFTNKRKRRPTVSIFEECREAKYLDASSCPIPFIKGGGARNKDWAPMPRCGRSWISIHTLYIEHRSCDEFSVSRVVLFWGWAFQPN